MKEEYDFTKDKTFDVYTIEELLEQYRDNDYYNLSKIENITKLCEEIERLNNIINKFEKYLEETKGIYEEYTCAIKKLKELKGVNKE